jgi:outer membrane protein TolC
MSITYPSFARRALITLGGIGLVSGLPACQTESVSFGQSISVYRDRMLSEQPRATPKDPARPAPGLDVVRIEPLAQLAGSQDPATQRQSLMTGPDSLALPSPSEVLDQLPDPAQAQQVFQHRLDEVRKTAREDRIAKKYERVITKALEYLRQLDRAQSVRLGLSECIQRALEHNYTVRIDTHNPAIAATRLVEAEAAFDAIFFLNYSDASSDQPTASQLAGSKSKQRAYSGGIRQLFPSGMSAEVSMAQSRNETDLQFATVNPSYSTTFQAQFSQPILRNFGLDVNRATINLRRTDLRISEYQFYQRVRDTLLGVEQAYWQLVSARRNATILAESVAQNYDTYRSMEQRQQHDATPVELANSEARWRSREVEFIEAVKQVRDAEDQLKNLINDPDLLLSVDTEIVPTQTPFAAGITLDHFGEVRTALDHRSEIFEAKERIGASRIQTAVAKNQTLPQLDLTFNYQVQGLATNADGSFDGVTSNRFRSYTVGVNFSYPIGNRGPRSAHRRARLQESQAITALQQVMDNVVLEVNNEIRRLLFRYKQLPPQLRAVHAAVRNLSALQARTQAINPSYLETELANIEQLAANRRTLLQVLIDYNIGIVQLEKAKGTLLDHNNVTVK